MSEKRFKILILVLSIFAVLTVILWFIILSPAKNLAGLYFLNIGQGDSQLIILADGKKILIDAGPSGSKLLSNLEQILPINDRYIDLAIMTHPQLDHFGGFIDLLSRYKVGAFIVNGRSGTAKAYASLAETIKNKNVPYLELKEGDLISLGEPQMKVLSPSPVELKSEELNDTGLVLLLDGAEYDVLYTADIGTATEQRLAKKYDLKADVLKVAHHGSRFSSDKDFLAEVDPKISIIGVGKNSYGHPTSQTLSRLASVSDQVLRTDTNGLIKIISENGVLKILNLR